MPILAQKYVLGWIKHWASDIHDNTNSIQMLPDIILNPPLHTVLPKRTSLLLANSANKYYYLGKWSSDTHSPTPLHGALHVMSCFVRIHYENKFTKLV